jgi:hypothetical protein
MRYKAFAALMISLLFLTACSGGKEVSEDRFLKFREQLCSSEGVTAVSKVRAETEEATEEYEMSFTQTGEGAVVEVLGPEELKGIKATLGGDPMTVEYQGVILETGGLGSDDLTPITALPMIVEAMKGWHIENVWGETVNDSKTLAAKIFATDRSDLTVWLDYETMTPLYAEITLDGYTVIFCTIEEWQS